MTTCSIVQRLPLARCDGHICCKLCPQMPRKASPSSSICSSGGSPSQTSAMPPLSEPAGCCCLCSHHTGFASVHAVSIGRIMQVCQTCACACQNWQHPHAVDTSVIWIPSVPCSGTAHTHHSTAQYNPICTCCAVAGMISRSGCCSAK